MRRAVRYACTHLKPGFEVGTHLPRRYLTLNFQTLRSLPHTPRINVGSEGLCVIFLTLLPAATWSNIEFEGRGLDLRTSMCVVVHCMYPSLAHPFHRQCSRSGRSVEFPKQFADRVFPREGSGGSTRSSRRSCGSCSVCNRGPRTRSAHI